MIILKKRLKVETSAVFCRTWILYQNVWFENQSVFMSFWCVTKKEHSEGLPEDGVDKDQNATEL